MSLSDKISEDIWLHKHQVKEFIRELKEMTKKWEQGKFDIIVWKAWVDKLAGEKLI